MKKTGIWLDRERAHIITFENGQHSIKTIDSGVETQERVPGETDDSSRFGEQPVNHEKQKDNRQQEQVKQYFKQLDDEIRSLDRVVLFGPAEIKTRYGKQLKEQNDLGSKLEGIYPADSMTENQMVAFVREYFEK